MRRRATGEQQAGLGEPIEPAAQLGGGPLRHLPDQLIAEFAAHHRADLRDLLDQRPEPVDARDQGGVQGGRDRQRRRWAGCQCGGAVAAFKHRLGQLLDEQRYAVGALDDFVHGGAGETGVAGETLD